MRECIGMEWNEFQGMIWIWKDLDFKSLINLVWFVGFGMGFEFQTFVNLVWFVGFGRGFVVHPLLLDLTDSQFSPLGVSTGRVGSFFGRNWIENRTVQFLKNPKHSVFAWFFSVRFGFKTKWYKNVLVFGFRHYYIYIYTVLQYTYIYYMRRVHMRTLTI